MTMKWIFQKSIKKIITTMIFIIITFLIRLSQEISYFKTMKKYQNIHVQFNIMPIRQTY